MAAVVNINDVLDGHVRLEIECADRLYLNAYVPILQVGPQVRRFLEDHLGNRLASPALIPKIGNRFRAEVRAFAAQESIPVLRLKKPDRTRWDDRKPDHVRPWLDKAGSEGRFGVVAIVAAQEFQFVYSAARRAGASGGVFRLHQGGAPGRRLLLLRPRPRVRARLHQDLHLLPVSRQDLPVD